MKTLLFSVWCLIGAEWASSVGIDDDKGVETYELRCDGRNDPREFTESILFFLNRTDEFDLSHYAEHSWRSTVQAEYSFQDDYDDQFLQLWIRGGSSSHDEGSTEVRVTAPHAGRSLVETALVHCPSQKWTLQTVGSDSEQNSAQLHNPFYTKVLSVPSRKERLDWVGSAEVWKVSDEKTWFLVNSVLKYISGDAGLAHAEAMVHPAMLSHPHPLRVAIVSSTPLPLVHEVRKHSTRKEELVIYVFGATRETIELFARAFPEYRESVDSYVLLDHWEDLADYDDEDDDDDDPCEDHDECNEDDEKFDVIFIDVDRIDELEDIVDTALNCRRNETNSAVVVNAGSSPTDDDPRTQFLQRTALLKDEDKLDAETVHVYEEPLAAPLETAFFLLTGDEVNSTTFRRFFRKNAAAIDLDMAQRMQPSLSTFHYDGSTHVGYLRPSRAWERWYCRTVPWTYGEGCTVFLSKIYDISSHTSDGQVETRVTRKGRTLFAGVDLPKGTLVNAWDAAYSIWFDAAHYSAFQQLTVDHPSALLYKSIYESVDGYGFQVSVPGFGGHVVTTTMSSFMNHACTPDEETMGPLHLEEGAFSPLQVRRHELVGVHSVTTRDVAQGEELLYDYRHNRDDFVLKDSEARMCAGDEGVFKMDQADNLNDIFGSGDDNDEKRENKFNPEG